MLSPQISTNIHPIYHPTYPHPTYQPPLLSETPAAVSGTPTRASRWSPLRGRPVTPPSMRSYRSGTTSWSWRAMVMRWVGGDSRHETRVFTSSPLFTRLPSLSLVMKCVLMASPYLNHVLSYLISLHLFSSHANITLTSFRIAAFIAPPFIVFHIISHISSPFISPRPFPSLLISLIGFVLCGGPSTLLPLPPLSFLLTSSLPFPSHLSHRCCVVWGTIHSPPSPSPLLSSHLVPSLPFSSLS